MDLHSKVGLHRTWIATRDWRRGLVLSAMGLATVAAFVWITGTMSRADDPPKPAKVSEQLQSRIRTQRERFVRVYETLADPMKELDEMEKESINQVIRIDAAKAAYQNARLTREVAEMALVEYETGAFKQEQATVEGEKKLAEAALERVDIDGAGLRVERARTARRAFSEAKPERALEVIGNLLLNESLERAEAALRSERVRLQQARFERERAQTDEQVLLRFTKPKRIRELKSAIEKAKADELVKEQSWDLEKKKQKRIEAIISLQSWSAEGKALLALLDEVEELESRLPDEARDAKLGGDQPRPDEAEVRRTLDAMQAKLDEAERVATALKHRREDEEYAAAASRVRSAAVRARQGR